MSKLDSKVENNSFLQKIEPHIGSFAPNRYIHIHHLILE